MPRAITDIERDMFHAMLNGEYKHKRTNLPNHEFARRVTKFGSYYLFSTKVAQFDSLRRKLQIINAEAIPDGLGNTQLTQRVLRALATLSTQNLVTVEKVDGWAT